MKIRTALFVVILITGMTTAAMAREGRHAVLPLQRASQSDESSSDRPPRSDHLGHVRADTLYFGNVDGDGFALSDDVWDWDGGSDPFQGWYAVDQTAQTGTYFRHINASIWTTGTGNLVSAPILNGVGSLWVGLFESEADELCWESGLGYGNRWCQRAVSPTLGYIGFGSIDLGFEYFNDTELNFDYTRVLLRSPLSGTETSLNLDGFTGQIGLAPDHPTGIPSGAVFSDVIDAADLNGESTFQIVFEFTSDTAWSDEDGDFATDYSAFGVDDVTLSGALVGSAVTYGFENGLDDWTPGACPGFGTFMGVRASGLYDIEDACDCAIAGNALEFHDDQFEHPYGQYSYGVSNPVDVLHDVPVPGIGSSLLILAKWDQYSVLPRANGVFWREGWDYFPFICPVTGNPQWSGRVANDTEFLYAGNDPVCERRMDIATNGGVPGSGVEQIRFLYEVFASCDAFGIPPEVCTHETNFTPIIDNLRIGFAEVTESPRIEFAVGTRYQDTFAVSDVLDPRGVGRADVVVNTNFGNTAPFIAGDSLAVSGPVVTANSRWESRLWFRINREGPGIKPARYNAWKTALSDGKNITGGEFAYAWMDSFQIGSSTAKNRFVSYLRETGEDDYNWDGGGEQTDRNEIIRDDVLVAGTGIDYFVTSNYTVSPTLNFTLPDTTGQFFFEFSVLPNWIDSGGYKFPCLLYVDAFNGGAEFFIENALDAMGIPYDRYDYLDAASNWKMPMARGRTINERAGVTLPQLLGYKVILVNTGTLGGQCMWPEDFVLIGDWLTAIHCDSNVNRQGLILNGDNIATIIESTGPAFLTTLGVVQVADRYNVVGAPPDQNYCVELESPLVPGRYGTAHSLGDYDYDAFGNWCPEQYSFDVLGAVGSGTGNRAFVNVETGAVTNYAQVVNRSDAAAQGNFRSVVDGISYHHLSDRDPGFDCPNDSAHVVTAVANELRAALEWQFGVGGLTAYCNLSCSVDAPDPSGSYDAGTTRLYQNSPNPFHPRTVLRFSLAETGNAVLSIFDVNGRLVKSLVDGPTEAGLHEVAWDGTDEAGNAVASGVFWSQLSAGGFTSNKKMVVLR